MEQAKALTAAIEEIVKARKQNIHVTAIWAKLDRVANYLNEQLTAEVAKLTEETMTIGMAVNSGHEEKRKWN